MFRNLMHKRALAIVASATLVAAAPAHANVIGYYSTVFDTDWTTAGTGGLRSGSGTITVSGVSGPVTQSLLYWQGPTNTTDPNAMANIQVNGNGITGTNIGFSSDNFWNYRNGQAYRADTSAIISGNGAYAVSGFNTAVSTGNGAGTAVFFRDANGTNNRDVVIFNGNDSNFATSYDPAGWDITLNGINYTSGQAFLRLFVSDGQNFGANDDGTLRVNGVPIASGGLFQGDSLPGASVGNGNLFDIKSYDITSFLTPGSNSLHVTLNAGFTDALSAITAFIDLPAGAAPIPEPSSIALLGIGAAGVLAQRRKRA